MLIGVLMVVAVALLISAFLTGSTSLAVVALVISVAMAVLYVFLLRRPPETDGASTEGPAEAEKPDAEPVTAEQPEPEPESADKAPAAEPESEAAEAEPVTVTDAEKPTREPAEAPAAKVEPAKVESTKVESAKAPLAAQPAPTTAAPAAPELDGTTVVHVVPGRMRFHVDGCVVLDGQEVEDLTVDDARDEGFTACSRCAGRKPSPATA